MKKRFLFLIIVVSILGATVTMAPSQGMDKFEPQRCTDGCQPPPPPPDCGCDCKPEGCQPPPPPPDCGHDCKADCSPGFWKNHLDAWSKVHQKMDYNVKFNWPEKPDGFTLLDALQGGKDTRFTRHKVANWLNHKYPNTICD